MNSVNDSKLMILAVLYLLLSFVYIVFYAITRQMSSIRDIAKEKFWLKTILCLLLNWLILKYQSVINGADNLTILLIVILVDIDVFIEKIPTELLCLLLIRLLYRIITTGNYYYLICGILSFIIWVKVYKRLHMGFYDILMITVFSLFTENFTQLFLFYSMILILWGLSGIVLQKVFKKNSAAKIPLIPVFAAALVFMNFIQRGYLR